MDKQREKFWNELNESRDIGRAKHWNNIFPEASIIDFNLLTELNQYLVSTNGRNCFFPEGQSPLTNISPAHCDARIKPFFSEFIQNYKRIDTEIDWNSLLFFSLSDGHHGVNLHRDVESVILIQGYGKVAYVSVNDDGTKKDIWEMETGDVLLFPPMYAHKSIPLGPRVTLSLGGLPKRHEQQN